MNLSGFYEESISNGLGWRAVVFVSGCPHHCPDCQNEEAQSFTYGEPFQKQAILEKIMDNSILKGITMSGGEPLCPENIAEVLAFINEVKQQRPNFTIWCYTGYTLEELMKRSDTITQKCLHQIDVLIDGRFLKQKKDPTLKFRGSSNQRLIQLKETLKTGKIILLEI